MGAVMIKRFAILNEASLVRDVQMWHESDAPDNSVASDAANIGDVFNPVGAVFVSAQPSLTPEQHQERLVAALQLRLDDFARSRNYDSILSACTYATSTVAKFKSEGQACVNLRDATWAAAYNILAQVNAGQRPMPRTLADIEAELPALVWPQ
jgi:hypothetical protein